MAVSMETLRRFAAADPGEADGVLEACLEAAVEWFEGAGVPQSTGGALYDLMIMQLAAYYYDSRGTADVGDNIPEVITNSLHQLRARGR